MINVAVSRAYDTQKLTRSILALKLSVAQPVYLWVTATINRRSLLHGQYNMNALSDHMLQS